MELAVIGGTGVYRLAGGETAEAERVATRYGDAEVRRTAVALPRRGLDAG